MTKLQPVTPLHARKQSTITNKHQPEEYTVQDLTVDGWDELISQIVRSLGGSIEIEESGIVEASLGDRGRRRERSNRESEDERSEVHCECRVI